MPICFRLVRFFIARFAAQNDLFQSNVLLVAVERVIVSIPRVNYSPAIMASDQLVVKFETLNFHILQSAIDLVLHSSALLLFCMYVTQRFTTASTCSSLA